MMHPAISFPPKEIIELQAAEMPPKVPLWDYKQAMESLRDKGYSYGEIADWISGRLGVEITRNRVAYVINAHPIVQEIEEKQDEAERLSDEAEEREILPMPPPPTKAPRRKKKVKQ